MSKPPPVWSALWRDVITHEPSIQWPVADEVTMGLIGKDWHGLGVAYLAAGEPQPASDQTIGEAWTGHAGQEYGRRVVAARGAAGADGEELQTVGQIATVFAEEVLRTKDQITQLIEHHEEFYADLTQGLWAWFNAEESRREAERYRMRVAGEIGSIVARRVTSLKERISQ